MSIDVQTISLDVSKQPDVQAVRLGQGDANGTQLVVNVFDDGVPLDLGPYTVELSMQLPNLGGYYGVNGTASGNVATFDIDETYAASVPGENGFGYVDVMDGDDVVCSTSRFQLIVKRSAEDGMDPSTAYSNGIREATERAIAAAEAAEGVVLQDVPLMSETIRGGAQLGTGLEITDGVLSLSGESYTSAEKTKLAGIEANANNYTLPTMGASTKGGAKLGDGLSIANDVLSVDASSVTSGTLPIAQGGTGSTTADDARAAIGASRCWYATCSTAAATAAKEASCTGFVLETGTMVAVRFSNTNSAASATLNVNSTGAKAIYANASTTAANVTWVAGETVTLVYDGTCWRMTDSVGLNALRESVSQTFDNTSGAISNANNAPFGVCTVNNSTANTPFPSDSNTTCMMLTVGFSTLVLQVIFNGGAQVWQRRKTSQGWQSWYKFTGESVS